MNRRNLIGALVSFAAFPISLWKDRPKFKVVPFADGLPHGKPVASSEYPILIRFQLEERLTGKPWAKAKIIGTMGWGSPTQARAFLSRAHIYVWNPRINLFAWVGLGTFKGEPGDTGYAVLSKGIRQPTHNNRECLPTVISMDGSELAPLRSLA